MPDVDWNKALWDRDYRWDDAGEIWSVAWGGSEAQWFGSLFPRLHRLLPARRILEIAPGFGRWSRFLIPACTGYLGIDLSQQCITACQARFGAMWHARFAANDGMSLDDAPDGSFDLVFSFDSLVHVEFDVFERYIPQIVRKLAPGGVAFLHHSNLLDFGNPEGKVDHARGRSVSGRNVAALVERSGGALLVQEVISWVDTGLLDCLTTFGLPGEQAGPPVCLVNPNFMAEAALIRTYQSPYSAIAGGVPPHGG